MPPDHLYQYRWLAVIVSVYPSCTVDLTAQKLPGMAWYIFDAEFRRQAFYNLSIEWGGNTTSIFTFMGLPKSGCCSFGSTDHLSDACPLHVSPCKSWDAPNHLPVDKLTYIQEALCRWANRKSATLYELQSLIGTRQFAYKIYCPRRVLSFLGGPSA